MKYFLIWIDHYERERAEFHTLPEALKFITDKLAEPQTNLTVDSFELIGGTKLKLEAVKYATSVKAHKED